MLEGNALKEIFRKNLNGLLAESGHTQKELADYVGVTPASVSEWLKGRKQPRMNKIDMICNFFGVDRTALLGIPVTLTADTRREIVTPAKKFVPVVGSVRCGPGGPCYEDITEYLTVDVNCPADEMIALRVEGDSMTPSIMPGDTAFIHKQDTVESGTVALCVVDNEEGMIKKVRFDSRKTYISLESTNEEYPPRVFHGTDMQKVRVLGRVVETRRKW